MKLPPGAVIKNYEITATDLAPDPNYFINGVKNFKEKRHLSVVPSIANKLVLLTAIE
jgi:hypothetical protein